MGIDWDCFTSDMEHAKIAIIFCIAAFLMTCNGQELQPAQLCPNSASDTDDNLVMTTARTCCAVRVTYEAPSSNRIVKRRYESFRNNDPNACQNGIRTGDQQLLACPTSFCSFFLSTPASISTDMNSFTDLFG